MLENFTFLMLSYNQEAFVIMHLESIRYQIMHYFNGTDVALVIADDGSKDRTLFFCQEWIKRNRELFKKITILGDGTNRGTCSNFLEALKCISSDKFFVLAADDLYGYKNLKRTLQYLDAADIVSAPAVRFSYSKNGGYEIDADYNNYKTSIAVGLCHKLWRRAFTIAGCLLEAPPAFYRRCLINNRVMDFIGKFRLIEDQPMMYMFFKDRKIRMKYLNYAYVYYRLNPDSVSHTQDERVKNASQQDLMELCRCYLKNESNPIYKYIVFLRIQLLKGRRWAAFLYPTNHYLVIKQKIFPEKIQQYYFAAIGQVSGDILSYIKSIDKRAKKFMEQLDIRK